MNDINQDKPTPEVPADFDTIVSEDTFSEPEKNTPAEHSDPVSDNSLDEEPADKADEAPPRAYTLYQNINVKASMFTDLGKLKGKESISLPPGTNDMITAALQRADRQQSVDADWRDTVDSSTNWLYNQGEFERPLSREGSEWTNLVHGPKGEILAPMRLKPSSTGDNSVGDRAVMAMNQHMGLGGPVRFPYWNSGFWASLRSPSDSTIYNLVRDMVTARVSLGRMTYALSFSDHMVSTVDVFFNAYRSHISNTTLSDLNDLGDVMTLTDIPTMMLHLAAAVYPNGFEYSRSCIADYSKCQHVTTGRLIPNRCLIVDHSLFNEAQLRHMATTGNRSCTKEKALEYQKSLKTPALSDVMLEGEQGNKVRVKLRVPSINEYITSGREWIAVITKAANDAIGMDATVAEKNEFMFDMSLTVKSRALSHWIESIEIDTGSEQPLIFTDRPTIDQLLSESMTRDTVLSDALAKAVNDFMESVTTSIVGILNYKCPKCNNTQYDVRDKDGNILDVPSVIPLDIASTFFDLLRQLVESIKRRA